MRFLRTNTAVLITVGPFYDKTDGVTPETSLTITNERITLTADTDDGSAPTNILDNVTGATSGTSNDLNYITGNDAAMMQLELSAANTNRLGRMFLSITDAANHVPVFHEFMVLPAMIYDAFVSGTDVLDASMTQILGTAVGTPATAGILDVNIKNIDNDAASASGTVTFPNATLASTTNITAGTITNLTNAPIDTNRLYTGGIDAVTSQTDFTLQSGLHSTVTNSYIGCMAIFTDTDNQYVKSQRIIQNYNGTTRRITIDLAPDFTVTTADTIFIIPFSYQLLDISNETDNISGIVGDLESRIGTPSNLSGAGGATLAGNAEDIWTMADVTNTNVQALDMWAGGPFPGLYGADTAGEIMGQLRDRTKALVFANGTIGATGNTTTTIHLSAFTYGDDEINDYLLVIYDVSEAEYHARYISDWVNSTKLATVETLPFAPQASTDGYFLIPVRQTATGTAAGIRSAIGMASANLDTQLSTIDDLLDTEIAAILADTNELQTDWANGGRLDNILDAKSSQTSVDTIDGIVDAILIDTGTDIPASISALNDVSVTDILTTQMSQSYATDGSAPTIAQALMMIQQMLGEFSISGTTLTVKQLNGSTTAATFTLNDATNPTAITRAS